MANKIYYNSKKTIRKILMSESMTKDELLNCLFNFSILGKNLVPLEIKKGKLESKIVDDIINKDECIKKNKENLLIIKQRCKSRISNSFTFENNKKFEYNNIFKGCYFDFCGDKVKFEPLYSPEMAKIVHLIPDDFDLGALFTIPNNNKIFELYFPLYRDDDESFTFEINQRISKKTAYEKYDNTYSLVEKYLKDYIPECDVESTLYKFLNILYPISICSYEEHCIKPNGENHTTSPINSEDYLKNSNRLKNIRCRCGRDFSFRVTRLKSDRIKKDLVNGVFAEWFASKKIEAVGLKNTLWNTNIIFDDEKKHFDAIGFNDDFIILIECKRIYKENTEFKKAVKKLFVEKDFLEKRYPEKDIIIGLMTNFRNPNIIPENIDFHINNYNFLDFEEILKNYV